MKEKRSDLPDSVFGIPSQRKYPMQDKEHVLSAIKFFNYVDEDHEKELAKNIIKNMKKYNIPFDVVGKKNRLRNYIPKKYIEEGTIHNLKRTAEYQKYIKKYYRQLGMDAPNGLVDIIKRFKGYNAGMMRMVQQDTDLSFLKYLRTDTQTLITTINIIGPRIDKCKKLGDCKETHTYYKGINKLYISKGVTAKDCEIAVKGVERMISEISDRIKEVRKMIKDGTIKEDATGNAIVGTNQPDSVYIVNYMQRNSFSGELEEHKGVCKKDMKNIHIFSKAKKKMIPKSLDEFTYMIEGDISLIKTPSTDFIKIIENTGAESDIDLLIREYIDSYIGESMDMSTPSDEPNLLQEIQILEDAQRQELDANRYNHRCELPALESYSLKNTCNYYTDINGYFIKNELTGIRSASYDMIDDIPSAVKERIKSI